MNECFIKQEHARGFFTNFTYNRRTGKLLIFNEYNI